MTQTVSSGCNTWFAIFMDTMKYSPEEAFEANKIQKFFADNEEFYTNTRSAASTAVLTSANTTYGYISSFRELSANVGSGKEEDLVTDIGDGSIKEDVNERRAVSEFILNRELHGAFDAANFSHIPVKVLWDEHITREKLKDISTLVLPTSACLSDEQTEVIMEFVNNGGCLAAFFECGFYDENGNSANRQRWLSFLGIKEITGAFVPSSCEDYILLHGNKMPGFRNSDILIPRTYNALKIVPKDGLEVLADFMNPIGKSYEKIRGISEFPALVCSQIGKGRVVYCAGSLFESITRFHLEDHFDVFKSILKILSGDSLLQIEINAPRSLAVEIRKNHKYTIIHLMNATGDMKRPVGRFVPLKDINISVRHHAKPKSIKAIYCREELEFKYKDGFLNFKLSKIESYEVIIIEDIE